MPLVAWQSQREAILTAAVVAIPSWAVRWITQASR